MVHVHFPRASARAAFFFVVGLLMAGLSFSSSAAADTAASTPATTPVKTAVKKEQPVNAPATSGTAGQSNESSGKAKTADSKSDKDTNKKVTALRQQRDQLQLENSLRDQQQKKDLAAMQAENDRLTLENSLAQQKLIKQESTKKAELDKLGLEIDQVNKSAALAAAKQKAELNKELAALQAEDQKLKLANDIANEKVESKLVEMRYQDAQYKLQKSALETQIAQLQGELVKRQKHDELADLAPDAEKYTMHPFKDGELVISDRRIPLNGVITAATADFVCERIDYYNNKSSEYPIFIVIDYSPGGSVMAGYKILKAMQGSKAPVEVVVKSFAASMAATITTLAEHSYAYPNAIILHHQISGLSWGNITQQKEALKEAEEWWQRLATPVAKKMGITLSQFVADMYKNNSDGDWQEFGDQAKKLKWVDHVVQKVWETSYNKNPDRFPVDTPQVAQQLKEQVDKDGNRFVVLPRLRPFDFYFLYNPDHYYRLN